MYTKFGKRLLDILLSLILIPLIIILVIIVGIAIKLDDSGPIFYRAVRRGQFNTRFRIFKFRTMKVNAPDIRNTDNSTYNSDNDPRVTRIGKLLRKTSIDELPQIFNVFLGNMSFIGPRPNMATKPDNELSNLELQRLQVKPGITGYNQAYYRNSVDMQEKIKNDVYYTENLTLKLDFKILLKTVVSVIKKDNINNEGY